MQSFRKRRAGLSATAGLSRIPSTPVSRSVISSLVIAYNTCNLSLFRSQRLDAAGWQRATASSNHVSAVLENFARKHLGTEPYQRLIYIIKGDMFVCLSVCLFRMAGQTAGPIETKLDTRTHVHPGSVSGKVNVKVIHVCLRE